MSLRRTVAKELKPLRSPVASVPRGVGSKKVNVPTDLHYCLHETPAALAALTDLVARQQRIWIDTELADWNTPNPRLSLIQLRLQDGSIHVVDVLSPSTAGDR